ncbi:Uncharacterized conserved protein YeaO, DUF488 family [Methylophilus rhizosphaerae]|uniref:Uncharacterized conserved protein YeaO, DUF488 family n=1 Tax=Methylophilus rhizosphaerae TaxID=492660 RepID=A0A1G8ZWL5_9PROT|nr:DUF488 domain-containing protein [Methylophilus rhizosphaerae]SDK19024.1 Uncharacterized conserved protein YeaO, DUF488 family [Methylophilus rhizosphaerae]
MSVSFKRVYESPASTDGRRVLVDRIWPRGITKEQAKLDLWLKEVAPSTALRKWFGHDPAKWEEFRTKYRAELGDNPAVATLKELVDKSKVTLVYAAKDEKHNHVIVLREYIAGIH